MTKPIDVSYTDMQVVLRAQSPAFCRCAGGNCGGAGCDCSKAFSIASDCLDQVGGAFFVKLSRSNNSIRRLVCCLAQSNDRASDDQIFQVLGKTSIIDDLVEERELAVRVAALHCTREKAKTINKRWKRNKKHAGKMANVPRILTIPSPQIGDIQCCNLNVLSASMKSKGPKSVAMELNSESLTWLANAIDWQYNHGDVKSAFVHARCERKRAAGAIGNSDSDSDTSTYSKESAGDDDAVGDQVAQPQEEPVQPEDVVEPEASAATSSAAEEPLKAQPASAATSSAATSSAAEAPVQPKAPAQKAQPPAQKAQLKLSDMFRRA